VVCGALAEESRLRVFAAVVMGAGTQAAVAEATGLLTRDVVAAVRRLTQAGLLATSAEGGLVAQVAVFKDTVRQYSESPAAEEPLDPDRVRAAVLRAFISDGRLVSLPAARGKRKVVLEHIVTQFEPGIRYPEREVDAVLRAWHPDYVTLRRNLIDEALMARDNGIYWRIGGPVY